MTENLTRRNALAGVSVAALAVATGSHEVAAAQPNMEKALFHLREARSFLNKAKANKGGHRKDALDLVQRAINQTKKGIDAV